MIASEDGKTLVMGASVGIPVVKSEEENVRSGDLCIIGEDFAASKVIPVYVHDSPALYKLEPIQLSAGAVYKISGITLPVNTHVFLSPTEESLPIKSMLGNAIAQTQSDNNGSYVIEYGAQSDIEAVVWFKTDCSKAKIARLSVEINIAG